MPKYSFQLGDKLLQVFFGSLVGILGSSCVHFHYALELVYLARVVGEPCMYRALVCFSLRHLLVGGCFNFVFFSPPFITL